jgi:hypothetical protein
MSRRDDITSLRHMLDHAKEAVVSLDAPAPHQRRLL